MVFNSFQEKQARHRSIECSRKRDNRHTEGAARCSGSVSFLQHFTNSFLFHPIFGKRRCHCTLIPSSLIGRQVHVPLCIRLTLRSNSPTYTLTLKLHPCNFHPTFYTILFVLHVNIYLFSRRRTVDENTFQFSFLWGSFVESLIEL